MGKDSWKLQRSLQEEPVPTIEQMVNKTLAIPEERTQAIFSTMYMTAGRLGEVLALKKDVIKLVKINERDIILFENMKNLKNKRKKFKDLPMKLADNIEFWRIVSTFISGIEDTGQLFNIESRRVEQLLAAYVGMNPHFIRHIRLTHLAKIYGYSVLELMKFAGWSNPKYAERYVEYRWDDLLKEKVIV